MLRGGAKISTQGTLQSSTIWGSQLLLSITIARGKEALVEEECNFSPKCYAHFKLTFHTQERQSLISPSIQLMSHSIKWALSSHQRAKKGRVEIMWFVSICRDFLNKVPYISFCVWFHVKGCLCLNKEAMEFDVGLLGSGLRRSYVLSKGATVGLMDFPPPSLGVLAHQISLG
uniref:Uncharacterized protein n=1 Tax=Opuntia streptacantha TaxID=393608 RepID=A0A7C9D3P4_OPUST